MIGQYRTIENPRVGMQSLVGIRGEAPTSWGNYFSFSGGPRVLNFWAENLTAALRKFKLTDIKIVDYGDWCIILDDRIPPEWYYNKLCFTGTYRPTKEIAREIYDLLGDPNNEYEQFEDPVSYYEKRGHSYDPETGILRYNITARPQALNEK